MRSFLSRRWPLLLVLGGVALAAGGSQHPDPDADLSFEASTANMLADAAWIPSHVLLFVAFVLLTGGVWGLVRSNRLAGTTRRVALVAAAGALLSSVEALFHVLAVVDEGALRAGESTPILNTHLVLAVYAWPLLGFSVAGLAGRGAVDRSVSHPALAPLGVIGGFMWGLAAPVVVALRDQDFSWLFLAGIPMALWFVAVGVRGLRQSRSSSEGEALGRRPVSPSTVHA